MLSGITSFVSFWSNKYKSYSSGRYLILEDNHCSRVPWNFICIVLHPSKESKGSNDSKLG